MWRDELLAFNGRFPHPAWGPAHCRRVLALASSLAREGGADTDEDALFAAAYLHDLGAFPPYRREGVDHGARSVEVAVEYLRTTDFPAGKTDLTAAIIGGHVFDAAPAEPEAVFFHDADLLDFLGAIGAARILSITGLDDWAPDLPAAVRLMRRLAQELPGRLLTDPGRRLGRARLLETEAFLAALAGETRDFETL
ncbi:MAG: HD domain-containing protein [Patescibacteria group bacterium]